MKIFTGQQIREIDRYTVENEPVSSAGLMERAAGKLFEWVTRTYPAGRRIIIFAGPGNNGGDGLVLARLLGSSGYVTGLFYVKVSSRESDDWTINMKRLREDNICPVKIITDPGQIPMLTTDDIVVDAIFGTGLTRPADKLAASVIKSVNEAGCETVSIDIPSGLASEDTGSTDEIVAIKASHTLSFQFPKLCFMFPESFPFTGEWHILPIGLSREAISKTSTPYYYLEAADAAELIRKRGKFDHKGTYGHALLVAGSAEKAGAAVLASKAVLRTGAGLVTCHTPVACRAVIQSAVPEAMVRADIDEKIITSVTNTIGFNAVAAGPGIGTASETCRAIAGLLEECTVPLVLDADALNIIGRDKELLSRLRPGTILTPHPGEFERMAGKTYDSYSRLNLLTELAVKFNIIIVLKGAHTATALPDGRILFNSTGNNGLATAGSGDVLTGIILSLLAQGYKPEDAAAAGVYLHGLAGDIALQGTAAESIIASDITANLGSAFMYLKEKR
jgi:ADP-dependent NAD(P)H-hydrate dehydratase / NAD(P)H-hydrate epimerase